MIQELIFKDGFDLSMTSDQLEKISLERTTPKIDPFEPNSFYGNAHVLKLYAGLDPMVPIDRIIPHGVNLSKIPWDIELEHPIETILCHSTLQAEEYLSHGSQKNIIPIGAPYLYAQRLVQYQMSLGDAQTDSVVLFPAHSTHHLTAQYEMDNWFRAIENLKQTYNVTACMYWRDIQLGRHQDYLKNGIPVTTCGHMFDESFLLRLAWILSHFSKAFVNRLGSCVYYSAVSGLEVTCLNQSIHFDGSESSMKAELSKNLDSTHALEFFRSFDLFSQERKRLQWETACQALGKHYLCPPDELEAKFTSNVQANRVPAHGEGAKLTPNVLEALGRL